MRFAIKISFFVALALALLTTAPAIGKRRSTDAVVVAASASAQKGADVRIKNFEFEPRETSIKVGATVTWRNDEGSHVVTADDNSFSSPTLAAGKTYSRRFTKPGTYSYHCSFHGGPGNGMSGTIVVTR